MSDEFTKELQDLLNKHGVDTICDTPDFILAFQVLGLLNHIRVAEQLKKQWEGEKNNGT
jgi:hypothetical protein